MFEIKESNELAIQIAVETRFNLAEAISNIASVEEIEEARIPQRVQGRQILVTEKLRARIRDTIGESFRGDGTDLRKQMAFMFSDNDLTKEIKQVSLLLETMCYFSKMNSMHVINASIDSTAYLRLSENTFKLMSEYTSALKSDWYNFYGIECKLPKNVMLMAWLYTSVTHSHRNALAHATIDLLVHELKLCKKDADLIKAIYHAGLYTLPTSSVFQTKSVTHILFSDYYTPCPVIGKRGKKYSTFDVSGLKLLLPNNINEYGIPLTSIMGNMYYAGEKIYIWGTLTIQDRLNMKVQDLPVGSLLSKLTNTSDTVHMVERVKKRLLNSFDCAPNSFTYNIYPNDISFTHPYKALGNTSLRSCMTHANTMTFTPHGDDVTSLYSTSYWGCGDNGLAFVVAYKVNGEPVGRALINTNTKKVARWYGDTACRDLFCRLLGYTASVDEALVGSYLTLVSHAWSGSRQHNNITYAAPYVDPPPSISNWGFDGEIALKDGVPIMKLVHRNHGTSEMEDAHVPLRRTDPINTIAFSVNNGEASKRALEIAQCMSMSASGDFISHGIEQVRLARRIRPEPARSLEIIDRDFTPTTPPDTVSIEPMLDIDEAASNQVLGQILSAVHALPTG